MKKSLFLLIALLSLSLGACRSTPESQPSQEPQPISQSSSEQTSSTQGQSTSQQTSSQEEVDEQIYQIYQLYLSNGGTQTYEEWLTSIKGEKGDPGKDGIDGKNGSDGLTPFIGSNGHWWIGTTDTGVTAKGKDGVDGKDGTPGKDGTTTFNIDGKVFYYVYLGYSSDTDTWIKGYTNSKTIAVDGNIITVSNNSTHEETEFRCFEVGNVYYAVYPDYGTSVYNIQFSVLADGFIQFERTEWKSSYPNRVIEKYVTQEFANEYEFTWYPLS